jgi:hypothetical protein
MPLGEAVLKIGTKKERAKNNSTITYALVYS